MNQLEKTIRDLKAKYMPILEKGLGERVARLEITAFMNLIARCLFSKPWPLLEPRVTLPVGRFLEDKVKSLAVHWAKVVDLSHPTLGFAAAAGLDEAVENASVDVPVDLENLRPLKRSISGGPEPEGPKFNRDDSVIVARRMSWNVS